MTLIPDDRVQRMYRVRVALFLICTVLLLLLLSYFYQGHQTLNVLDQIERDRDQWQRPSDVIQALNLHEGSVVVDFGSGVGYFTLKLCSAVGKKGGVVAEDIRRQSLAEARLPVNGATTPHYHPRTEEIYYIVEGHGSMQVGNEIRLVGPGDAIAIPPGARHQIRNTDSVVLKFLCCCAPAYEDEDTVLD